MEDSASTRLELRVLVGLSRIRNMLERYRFRILGLGVEDLGKRVLLLGSSLLSLRTVCFNKLSLSGLDCGGLQVQLRVLSPQ